MARTQAGVCRNGWFCEVTENVASSLYWDGVFLYGRNSDFLSGNKFERSLGFFAVDFNLLGTKKLLKPPE